MYNLTKKEKLDFIKQKVKELNISAYTISKKINLTEAGIGKILNGTIKNPHESTIDILLLYLEEKVLGSEIDKKIHTIEEPTPTYEVLNNPLVVCLNEKNKLILEVLKLQNLLRENNISFNNIFKEEN